MDKENLSYYLKKNSTSVSIKDVTENSGQLFDPISGPCLCPNPSINELDMMK